MSTIQTNLVQTTSGKTILQSTGSVIQVVQAVKTSTFSSSSTTPVDVGLSCSITPGSSSNKILVLWCLNVEGYGHWDYFLQRNGSNILIGDAFGTQIRSTIHKYATSTYQTTYDIHMCGGQYLDSPATTSTLTYKWQSSCTYSASYFHALNGVLYHNQDATYNGRTPSILTLMEICG